MRQDAGMQACGSSWHPGVAWRGGNLGGERARVGGAAVDAEGQSEAPGDVRVKRSDSFTRIAPAMVRRSPGTPTDGEQ